MSQGEQTANTFENTISVSRKWCGHSAAAEGSLTYVGRIGLISGAGGWTPVGGRSVAAPNTRGRQTHNQGLAFMLLASQKTAALYFDLFAVPDSGSCHF